MKRCLRLCAAALTGLAVLSSCGREDYTEQKNAMLTKLTEKYSKNFYVIDIAKRPTSDVNSRGDVYYAYVACDAEDERFRNKGFYCEINTTLSNMTDSYLDICLQPALESRYKRYVPDDACVVGLVSTQGDEIISKYTYKNIVSNNIPYAVNIIIPITEDTISLVSGETESLKFEKVFREFNNSSYATVNIMYCDESYVNEYVNFVNHMLPFDYKVDYTKIYADASLSTENKEGAKEQFIRQIKNDLAALEASR